MEMQIEVGQIWKTRMGIETKIIDIINGVVKVEFTSDNATAHLHLAYILKNFKIVSL